MENSEQGMVDDENELVFNSLEDLIEFELATEANISEIVQEAKDKSELIRNSLDFLTEEASEYLCARALEVIKVVNPKLSEEINADDLVIGGRHDGVIEFDTCNSREGDEHEHTTVCVIPDTALVLDNDGWTKFLGMAKFLDETSILIMVVNDHCAGCGVHLTDENRADDDTVED